MAFVTQRLQTALEQVEGLQQRLNHLATSHAGAAELAEALGQLEAAWAEARLAAVEACQTGQAPLLRERRRPRNTPTRASHGLSR